MVREISLGEAALARPAVYRDLVIPKDFYTSEEVVDVLEVIGDVI